MCQSQKYGIWSVSLSTVLLLVRKVMFLNRSLGFFHIPECVTAHTVSKAINTLPVPGFVREIKHCSDRRAGDLFSFLLHP